MVSFPIWIPDCDSHSPALWVLLLMLLNFVSGFRLKLMYVSLIIDTRSSPIHIYFFQLLCFAAIAQRNHYLHLYQQNKSSKSKLKFRQASNHCKRVLEAAKPAKRYLRLIWQAEQWSNGLVVKVLDSQSRGPTFKTNGWLQGQLSLSSCELTYQLFYLESIRSLGFIFCLTKS